MARWDLLQAAELGARKRELAAVAWQDKDLRVEIQARVEESDGQRVERGSVYRTGKAFFGASGLQVRWMRRIEAAHGQEAD